MTVVLRTRADRSGRGITGTGGSLFQFDDIFVVFGGVRNQSHPYKGCRNEYWQESKIAPGVRAIQLDEFKHEHEQRESYQDDSLPQSLLDLRHATPQFLENRKHQPQASNFLIPINSIGAIGFEPTAPCSQGRCATRLRYAPIKLFFLS